MIDAALVATIRADLINELAEADAAVLAATAVLESASAVTKAAVAAHAPLVALIERLGQPAEGALGGYRRTVPATLIGRLQPHREIIRRAEGRESEARLVLEFALSKREQIDEAIQRLEEVAPAEELP